MGPKIINSHRYKTITRKKALSKKEQKYKSFEKEKNKKRKKDKKEQSVNQNFFIRTNIQENNFKEKNNYKKDDKENSKKIYIPKTFKIAVLVILLVGISFLSKELINIEDSPIIKVFSLNKEKEIDLVKDYDLKIGINGLDTTDLNTTQNIILREFEKLNNSKLISINKDYSITYLAANTIEKISNKEYNILLNPKYDVTIQDFKNTVENIKNVGESNIYYKYISNIESIEEISNKQFKIKLSQENPYFLYALDFPIKSDKAKKEYIIQNADNGNIEFSRKDSESTIKSIKITNFDDSDKMVEAFRNNSIDIFFASSNNAMQLIGKHEYNVKKYRNGETIFLFGNKDSRLYSKKEVREAILYSLNRQEIVKEVNNNYGEVIDLPFIYSNIKYKYDIYGAQNVLLSSSWKKGDDGIFFKQESEENIRLELNLLVNTDDQNKRKIAEKIKDMCYNSGIVINIEYLSKDEISAKVSNREYDLVLADVLVNDYPDITYLNEYVNINQAVDTAIKQVNNSSIESLPENISNLQNVLSSEVACIGIFARNINVVYQKDITGFEDLNYFKVFDNIDNIGKINDKIGG